MHSRRRRKSKKASFRDEPKNVAATLLCEKKTLIGIVSIVGLAVVLTAVAYVFIPAEKPEKNRRRVVEEAPVIQEIHLEIPDGLELPTCRLIGVRSQGKGSTRPPR